MKLDYFGSRESRNKNRLKGDIIMNKFYKVSKEVYLGFVQSQSSDSLDCFESIKLPKRATRYSAGYDFFAPYDFTLKPNEAIIIPTGVKIQLDDDKFLALVPRSSLGFKYRCQISNTIGIIDSDYFDNKKNEGHILVKLVNNGDKEFVIKQGEAFCQGIILQYFLTEDDDSCAEREGGIGSTNK